MFSLRAARPLLAAFPVRSFSTTVVSKKDFVQDLYVKELKAYKPNPAAVKDSASAVKSYSAPASPVAPLVLDAAALATELAAYDADTVTPEPIVASSTHAHAEEGLEGADEFLKLVEADIVHEAKH